MWFYDSKKINGSFGFPFEMITSPFSFPRLPPRANPPTGITNTGKIKEQIIHDSHSMLGRLSDHHAMFQRYASGLFNMTPNGFVPGHPMHAKMHMVDSLREENERLRQENLNLKSDLSKEKKK